MVILTLILLALVGYTYVGYPIAMALLARTFGRPAKVDPSFTPTVTVCIAVYNGAAYLADKLDSVLALDYPTGKLDVLVCSDCSTDETDAIVADYAARGHCVRGLRAETRSGKPSALNRMRREAQGEVLLMTDVRQVLSPNAARALVAMLADPRVGCVSGTLALQGDTGAGLYWRYELWIRRNEARFRGLVGVTGALYVVRAEDLTDLPEDTVLDDMLIPMRLSVRGRRIVLCDDAIAYDTAAEDDHEFARKARTLFGNYQLLSRMPRLLVPFAAHSWLEIMSHKVLRLVCPWLLLGLIASSVATLVATDPPDTQRWMFLALAAGQGMFYALAMAGRRAGRLAGVARTFVVLNAAAVVGLWHFVRGRNRVRW